MLDIYLVSASSVIVGQLAPGPNLLAVAAVALGAGPRVAMATALGVALTVFAWVAFAALGLTALLGVAPQALIVMKVVGGAYLIVLGARALLSAWAARRAGRAAISATTRAAPLTVRQAFWRGVLVNATNVKAALMWAAVATFMFGAGLEPVAVLAFAPIGAVTALLVYGISAYAFSRGAARRLYARFAAAFEVAFAAAFGAVGAALLFGAARDAARP